MTGLFCRLCFKNTVMISFKNEKPHKSSKELLFCSNSQQNIRINQNVQQWCHKHQAIEPTFLRFSAVCSEFLLWTMSNVKRWRWLSFWILGFVLSQKLADVSEVLTVSVISYQRPTTQKTVIHIHTHHSENLKYHKCQEVQIDLQIGHLLYFLRINTNQVMILILRINTVRFRSVYIILTLWNVEVHTLQQKKASQWTHVNPVELNS